MATSAKGCKPGDTRVTFILKESTAEKLKDYAYTERIMIKDAAEKAINEFLEGKNNLLKKP